MSHTKHKLSGGLGGYGCNDGDMGDLEGGSEEDFGRVDELVKEKGQRGRRRGGGRNGWFKTNGMYHANQKEKKTHLFFY